METEGEGAQGGRRKSKAGRPARQGDGARGRAGGRARRRVAHSSHDRQTDRQTGEEERQVRQTGETDRQVRQTDGQAGETDKQVRETDR